MATVERTITALLLAEYRAVANQAEQELDGGFTDFKQARRLIDGIRALVDAAESDRLRDTDLIGMARQARERNSLPRHPAQVLIQEVQHMRDDLRQAIAAIKQLTRDRDHARYIASELQHRVDRMEGR